MTAISAAESEARKKRDRRRRKRQRSRKAWANLMIWRGERLGPFSWYFVGLALAIGGLWGIIGLPGHRGETSPEMLAGSLGVGFLFAAIIYSCLPAVVANLALVAGFFVGAISFGPRFPGSISPGIMALLAGIIIGSAIRWVAVGRRTAPVERTTFIPRRLTRRNTRIVGKKKSDAYWTAGIAVLSLGLAAFLFLRALRGELIDYVIATGIALLWAVPTGRLNYLTFMKQRPGGTSSNVALWGVLLLGWAGAGVGVPFLFWFFTGMGGMSIGFLASQLAAARTYRIAGGTQTSRSTRGTAADS
ncbi:MAG TPA: hypothetical protein VGC18_10130 [Lacisediminihabitans sp.]|uniref:hypothetical protein n=1 Tax=Lacisediminihabitans sp. TaxID=2787631 RepID=UPI002ED8AE7B